jgi:hypothetical protein
MYPVVKIESLIDVRATEDGIELRLGSDPGGGQVGKFRYAALVNGVPDLGSQTEEIYFANTAAFGGHGLHGKRPNLIYHAFSGFRAVAKDSYKVLDAKGHWQAFAEASTPGAGIKVDRWSKDRLLELRGPHPQEILEGSDPIVPSLRVLQGSDKAAPSIPKNLERRLKKEGFLVKDFMAFSTGEVLAVGWLSHAKGIGTLLWKENLREPKYYVAEEEPVTEESEFWILGGDSLASMRMLIDDRVMSFNGSAWILERTVPKGSPPDVWFGSTRLDSTDEGVFARLAADAPWRRIEKLAKSDVEESYAVDPSGTIWKTEDDLLLSSAAPPKQFADITEEDLAKARKAN